MNNKRKCLIFSGGELNDWEFHKKRYGVKKEYIICADRGAYHARILGLKPDVLVGDFDSLAEEELEIFRKDGTEIIKYSSEKDFSDTQLALLTALDRGFQDIEILAALGSRFDHALANVMLLAMPEAQHARIRIVDKIQEMFIVFSQTEFRGRKGELVSLLPLSTEVTGIKTEGLKYEIPNGTFSMGCPIGISNELSSEKVRIEISKGILLVIRL